MDQNPKKGGEGKKRVVQRRSKLEL